MKPLIIGEAPSKNEETPRPIEGRVGRRLAACAGLTLEEFLQHFDRVNLLVHRQDTKEKGFEFDMPAAKAVAKGMRFKKNQVVLLLGGRVAEAFGIHGPYFEEFALGEAKAFIVPHPSGVNRWWNEQENRDAATKFMHEIVERTLVHV